MILTLPNVGVIDASTIETMLATYPTSTGKRRDVLEHEMRGLGIAIASRRDDLHGPDGNSGLLGAGMDYLEANDDEARWRVWTAWLQEYETCCDLLPRIAGVLYGAA